MGALAAALRDRVIAPVEDDLDYIKDADELMLAAAEMLEDAEKVLALLAAAPMDVGAHIHAQAILARLREPR